MNRIMFFLIFLCLPLFGCSRGGDFVGKVQFQVGMASSDWPSFLVDLKAIIPHSLYAGDDGTILNDKAAPRLFYAKKISLDGRYMVVVSQREGKANMSLIFYTSQSCGECAGWEVEASRVESALHARYGDRVTRNSGAITEIPF